MGSDALLERMTPKKKQQTTTVRRSRRLGPSVSIVGDMGENDETPLGKIRETATPKKKAFDATTTTTTTTRATAKSSRLGRGADDGSKKIRSPLMDRGNNQDAALTVTAEKDAEEEEEEKPKKKKSNKKIDVAKKQPAARKTRAKKEQKEQKETEKENEVTMNTSGDAPKDDGDEGAQTTRTTASSSEKDIHIREQEKIQEEMDNEDPMQILKLAVATWQRRGVDPSEAIFEAFPLRLSERKDGATMRRLMAALAGVELAPTTVKKARAIREEMFEDVEEEDVCDMVEDKEEVGDSKDDSKQKPKAEQSLEDHATRRLSFGSGNGEKDENAKEDEEEVAAPVAGDIEGEDEEFGTPEGKIEDEEGDIEGTFDPCNCGELECPKEKMLKNNGPFQLPVVKQEQPHKQVTPVRTWMDAEQPSLSNNADGAEEEEEENEEEDDSESVAATDVDENYSIRDEEEDDDNDDDDVRSIAGTDYVASPLVESIIDRASKNQEKIEDEPAPPEKEAEVVEEEEEEE